MLVLMLLEEKLVMFPVEVQKLVRCGQGDTSDLVLMALVRGESHHSIQYSYSLLIMTLSSGICGRAVVMMILDFTQASAAIDDMFSNSFILFCISWI